jgi:hypothetical protein
MTACETENLLGGWLAHFEANARAADGLDWAAEDDFSPAERARVEKSIAAFQLGEYSEGRGLLRQAEVCAARLGDARLVRITRLFIAEEQNHALLLKRFMSLHDMKPLRRHWTDQVFRRLRKFFGYEASVRVLITAELISLVYYRALAAGSGSQLLRGVCAKILRDEAAHVRYESEVLARLRKGKGAAGSLLSELLHAFLFAGTILVVYQGHRKVLRFGGYGPARFWSACWREFFECFPRRGVARNLRAAN